MQRPPAIVNIAELPWEEFTDGPAYTAGGTKRLTPSMPRDKGHLGVRLERLDPGCVSSAFHYHLYEDEFCLVMKGSVRLRLGDTVYDVHEGDAIAFPRGERVGHQFHNAGTTPVEILMVGENVAHEVVHYPDSGKWMLRSLKAAGRFAAEADYWDGEPAPPPA